MQDTFQVTGTKLIVTDPCYERDPSIQLTLEDVMPGTWKGSMTYADSAGPLRARTFRGRVAVLEVQHESFTGHVGCGIPQNGSWDNAAEGICVDSGQAGVFDEARYPHDPEAHEYVEDGSTFYGRACARTLGTDEDGESGGAIDEGFVSSSGYGDGEYPCIFHRNADGKVDCVVITFIHDNEDEDEDESDECEDVW